MSKIRKILKKVSKSGDLFFISKTTLTHTLFFINLLFILMRLPWNFCKQNGIIQKKYYLCARKVVRDFVSPERETGENPVQYPLL